MNLKELSKALSLSQTTVSRALNGYPEVSEATRRRVMEAAAQLNYRPNTRARSLATGRSMAIGHVIPMADQHEMLNPIFADFIAGAGETYHQKGYDMILTIVSDDEEPRVYRDLAARHSVDGLIVHAPRRGDGRIDLLREIGLPFVVHGRASHIDEAYSWVDVNNHRAFEHATGFLCDLGHRRIALLNGIETMDFAARRREGYLSGLAKAGLSPDKALMRGEEMTESYGFQSTKALLVHPDPPTAILVSSVIPANGVRRAIEYAGLKIGHDVSVIVYDDDLSYFRNGEDVPFYTSLKSSVRDAGRRAAAMLVDIVEEKRQEPCHDLLMADLSIGRSTGPAPALRQAINQG